MEGNINSEMLRNKPELERLQKIVNERLRDARISIDHYSHIVDEAKKVAHELNIPLNQITYRFELPKK